MALLLEFDPADVVAINCLIEHLTATALRRDVLIEIPRRNSHTEYLGHFMDHVPPCASATNLLDAFKEKVTVGEYEDIKLSGCSSGTFDGQQKLFPSTAEKLDHRLFYNDVQALLRKM
ncbi:hypothetical protein D1007_05905 [Hordeum vulgare]|nr:hypothetical protein D1007_05905 [Hordeum vulgare]